MGEVGTNGSPYTIPERELMVELGIDRAHVAKIRKKHLADGDWERKQGVAGRPFYLTKEGATKYRLYKEAGKTEPQIVPTFIGSNGLMKEPPTEDNPRVTVWEQYSNPRCGKVRIRIDYGPEKGFLIEDAVIPPDLHRLLTRDKPLRVEVIRDATGVSYRHESFATSYG